MQDAINNFLGTMVRYRPKIVLMLLRPRYSFARFNSIKEERLLSSRFNVYHRPQVSWLWTQQQTMPRSVGAHLDQHCYQHVQTRSSSSTLTLTETTPTSTNTNGREPETCYADIAQILRETRVIKRKSSIDEMVEVLNGYDESGLSPHVDRLHYMTYLNIINVDMIQQFSTRKLSSYLLRAGITASMRPTSVEEQRVALKNVMLALVEKMSYRELAYQMRRIGWKTLSNSKEQMRLALRMWIQLPGFVHFKSQHYQGVLSGWQFSEARLRELDFYFEREIKEAPSDQLKHWLQERGQSIAAQSREELVERMIAFQEFAILRLFNDRLARQFLQKRYWSRAPERVNSYELRRRCIMYLRHPNVMRYLTMKGSPFTLLASEDVSGAESQSSPMQVEEEMTMKAFEEARSLSRRILGESKVSSLIMDDCDPLRDLIYSQEKTDESDSSAFLNQLIPSHIKINRQAVLLACPILAFDGETRLWSLKKELSLRKAQFDFQKVMEAVCWQNYEIPLKKTQTIGLWMKSATTFTAQQMEIVQRNLSKLGKSANPLHLPKSEDLFQQQEGCNPQQQSGIQEQIARTWITRVQTDLFYTSRQVEAMSLAKVQHILKEWGVTSLDELMKEPQWHHLQSQAQKSDARLVLEALQEHFIWCMKTPVQILAGVLKKCGFRPYFHHSTRLACSLYIRHPLLSQFLLKPVHDGKKWNLSNEWTQDELKQLHQSVMDCKAMIEQNGEFVSMLNISGTSYVHYKQLKPAKNEEEQDESTSPLSVTDDAVVEQEGKGNGCITTLDGQRQLWTLTQEKLFEKSKPNFWSLVSSQAYVRYGLCRRPSDCARQWRTFLEGILPTPSKQPSKEHRPTPTIDSSKLIDYNTLPVYSLHGLHLMSTSQLTSVFSERVTSKDSLLQLWRNLSEKERRDKMIRTLHSLQKRCIRKILSEERVQELVSGLHWTNAKGLDQRSLLLAWIDRPLSTYYLQKCDMRSDSLRYLEQFEFELIEEAAKRVKQNQVGLPGADILTVDITPLDIQSTAFWSKVRHMLVSHSWNFDERLLRRYYACWLRAGRNGDAANEFALRGLSDKRQSLPTKERSMDNKQVKEFSLFD